MDIRQLPDTLANKIAAGEVVERPASVVKELVENSIDAKSTLIKIQLKEAGMQEIIVTDDGMGMSEKNAKNAFLRHATSKIQFDQDLFHIKSLGFRGEALASIASVSKLTVKTSTGNDAGTMLYFEGGKCQQEHKSDARQGTEIIVGELFYNTPARLKYLKSIHTELGHITDLINRYSLAHPDIRFQVMHNDKTIFKTAGTDNRLQVIQQIYGTQIAKNMMHVTESSLDFEVEAYLAKPEYTRANRNYITLIVNGRYIKSNALIHAIIRGYDTLLPIHRYPIAVIAIKMDPVLTDVNVHPTKLEIRFSKERSLIDMVENMVNKAFKSVSLIPEMQGPKKEKIQTEQSTMHLDPTSYIPESISSQNEDITRNEIQDIKPDIQNEELFISNPSPVQVQEAALNNDLSEQRDKERVPILYPIGQLQGTYILAQNERGFYMIDQHAAQERIKYEFFKKKVGETTEELQQLLMPLTFEFTNEEILFIQKHDSELQNAGLFLEPFGGQTYAVKAHPNWFPKGMEESVIRDLVNQVIHDGSINIQKLREEAAILMSCKRSIKANHYLTHEDMERLLNDLRKTEDPFTCPHGRPVIIHFTYYEIEKMFKRIM
ncbi:MAG TPA: DNA mismatch repair endonuclease MutL [Pseudogracilibacillus sp.]|nr:DNA mismatch repair endonuclease MutL [Pseudogracilibacillus sp.]